MWIEYHAGDCNNLNLQWIYVHNWGKYNTLFVLRLLILSVWSCIQAQGAGISRRPFWSLVAQCLPAFFLQREIFQVLFWYPHQKLRKIYPSQWFLEQVELFCIVDIPHTCLISKQASSNTYYRTRNRFLVISALQPYCKKTKAEANLSISTS